jgi:hypothetical protein
LWRERKCGVGVGRGLNSEEMMEEKRARRMKSIYLIIALVPSPSPSIDLFSSDLRSW